MEKMVKCKLCNKKLLPEYKGYKHSKYICNDCYGGVPSHIPFDQTIRFLKLKDKKLEKLVKERHGS